MGDFAPAEGFPGKVFVPGQRSETRRKHPCRQCFFCQMCGDDRCALCLTPPTGCCRPVEEPPLPDR